MSYKAKYRLQTHLRKNSIPYTTAKDFVCIGNISIIFYDHTETISFRDNRVPLISFCTPYSEPSTLMAKYNSFSQMIKKFLKGHAIFNIPMCNN